MRNALIKTGLFLTNWCAREKIKLIEKCLLLIGHLALASSKPPPYRHGKMLGVQLYVFSQLQPRERTSKEGWLTFQNTKGWKVGGNPSVPFRSGCDSVQLDNWSAFVLCPRVLCTLVAETEVKDNIFLSAPKDRYNNIQFRERILDFEILFLF